MQNSEYQFQHFGFTIEQQSLERRLKLRNLLHQCLESVIKNSSSSEETMRLLLAQKDSVSQDLLTTMEKDIRALEALDENYFTIPGHVLLETDFMIKKRWTEESEDELDHEISELTQLYLENCVFRTWLEIEEKQFTMVKPFIEDQMNMHNELKQCLSFVASKAPIAEKTLDLIKKF